MEYTMQSKPTKLLRTIPTPIKPCSVSLPGLGPGAHARGQVYKQHPLDSSPTWPKQSRNVLNPTPVGHLNPENTVRTIFTFKENQALVNDLPNSK